METQTQPVQDKAYDPIAALVREHQATSQHLRQLQIAAAAIRANGFSATAFHEIAGTIRHIDHELRVHNSKEEELLFPLLEEYVPTQVVMLKEEHKELRSLFDNLTQAVLNMENGRIRETSVLELLQSAETISQLLGAHITKENLSFFPMTRQLLSEEQYAQLATDIEEAGGGERA